MSDVLDFALNASSLQRDFGEMLVRSGYGGLTIRQEIAVQDLIPDYKNGRDRYDYYISELNLIVELHGEQHYKPVKFGGKGDRGSITRFIRGIRKDENKLYAAFKAGYSYISFSFEEQFTEELLLEKLKESQVLLEALHEEEVEKEEELTRSQILFQEKSEQIKKRRKEYSREKYKERALAKKLKKEEALADKLDPLI